MTRTATNLWDLTKKVGRQIWRKASGGKSGVGDTAGGGYRLTWLDENIATGYAPISRDDLKAVKAQGIDAIVNLCGEFCDLQDLQKDSGFEVYYLPIPDECAPDMMQIDAALDWIEQAVDRGKKILVHCRFGIGRTGTVAIAYLLRKGLSLKAAEKALRKTGARPSNYSQWRLLRTYARQQATRGR